MNTLARLDPGTDGWFLVLVGATALALIVAASGLLGRLLARRDPATSHAIDRVALLLILCLPALIPLAGRSQLFAVTWPRQEATRPAEIIVPEPPQPERPSLPLLPPAPEPEPFEAPPIAAAPVEPIAAAPAPITPAPMEPPPPAFEFDLPTLSGLGVAAWLTVSLLLTLRLIHGLMGLARLRRLAHPADPIALAELRNAFGPHTKLPPIFEVPGLPGPLAGGPISPAIYLPAGLPASLAPDALREILIHECAHAFRRDPLFGLLQRVATLLFWPHPAIHLLNRRLSRSREAVCDNHVLARSRRSSYARTLLSLAETTPRPPARRPAVLGLWETLEPLESRVRTILDERRPPVTRPLPLRTLTATLTLLLLALPLAGLRLLPPAQAGEARPEAVPIAPEPSSFAALIPSATPAADDPPVAFDPTFGVQTRTTVKGTVVNEKGEPVADISVNGVWFRKQPNAALTGKDGTFALTFVGPMRWMEHIHATNSDGSIQGYAMYREPSLTQDSPFRLVVKPSRRINVRVSNARDQGLPDVGVVVSIDSPFATVRTDAEGWARFQIPADARVQSVLAFKDRLGMDYHLLDPYYLRRGPTAIPDPVRLSLTGALSAGVKVVDENRVPRSGVQVYVERLKKPGKPDDCVVGSAPGLAAVTDRNGIAWFHWLPGDLRDRPIVKTMPWSDHELLTSYLRPGDTTPLEMTIVRNVKLSGRVVGLDGKPVANALIGIEGKGVKPRSSGYPWSETFYYTRTEPDGSYSLPVAPEHSYRIALLEPGLPAQPLTGIQTGKSENRGGADLQVIVGGRIHGAVAGPEGVPHPLARIRVKRILAPTLQTKADSPDRRENQLSSDGKATVEGKFDLTLAPGDYELSANDDGLTSETIKLEVTAGMNRLMDFHLKPDPSEPVWDSVKLAGTAVDGTRAEQPPVADAIVTAIPFGREIWGPPEGITNAKGAFEFEAPRELQIIRRPNPRVVFSPDGTKPQALVIARSKDGSRVGSVRIDDTAKQLRILMGPAAIITGRLLKPDSTPDVGRDIVLIQEYRNDEQSKATLRMQTITDTNGDFRFTGILRKTNCIVFAIPIAEAARGLIRPSREAYKEVEVERFGLIDIGRLGPAEDQPQTRSRRSLEKPVPATPPAELKSSRVRSGLSPMPYATTREDIVRLIQTIGREPATPELIDRLDLLLRPQGWNSRSVEEWSSQLSNPSFLEVADKASKQKLGRPAGTAELIHLSNRYHVGYDLPWIVDLLIDQSAPETSGETRGNVVDAASGKPVANALVWKETSKTRRVSTRTDAKGEFVLKGQVPERIWVEADGFALKCAIITDVKHARVELAPAHAASGRVVDPEGKPVPSGWVRVFVPPHIVEGTPPEEARGSGVFMLDARTNEDGWFTFPGLPKDALLGWYEFDHPHFHAGYRGVPNIVQGKPMQWTVWPGASLSGSVVTSDGAPVQGARITVRARNHPNMTQVSTHSDRDGLFTLNKVEPDAQIVLIEPIDHAAVVMPVVTSATRPTSIQAVVERGRYVTGTVVDAQGKPQPRAAVGWVQIERPERRTTDPYDLGVMTRADDKGQFRIGPLPTASVELSALTEGPRNLGKLTVKHAYDGLIITVKPDPIR